MEGHIAIIISIVAGFLAILRFLYAILETIRTVEKKLDVYSIEHEILIAWFQKENPEAILPTRIRKP